MVEIDFYGVRAVNEAFKALMDHINMAGPLPVDWEFKFRKFLTKLLSEMASALGYRLEQLDVLDGGYWPRGFANFENEQQEVRRALLEVLSGRRPVAVTTTAPTPPSPFPPPPPPPVSPPPGP